MKIILTESQLKTVIGERSIRYSEGEEYGISEQIDWLNMQKEFMFIHGEAGQKGAFFAHGCGGIDQHLHGGTDALLQTLDRDFLGHLHKA